jgi:hypothetical protein
MEYGQFLFFKLEQNCPLVVELPVIFLFIANGLATFEAAVCDPEK